MSDWTPNDVVRTTSGRVGGLSTTATDTTPAVRTWRGVPYGRADRFRAPTSPHPWKEIKDCTHYASVAAQPTYGPSDRIRGSEDCLNLDIVRPDHDRPCQLWSTFTVDPSSTDPATNNSYVGTT